LIQLCGDIIPISLNPGLTAALYEIANRYNEISRAIFPAGFLRAPKFGHPVSTKGCDFLSSGRRTNVFTSSH
jgi:hypothetical protein